jgi:glyoxylase-like metal-dependent hydrolase (beta-lactamase superfamily II)
MTIQSALNRRDALKLIAATSSLAFTAPALASFRSRSAGALLPWSDLPTPVKGFKVIADLSTGGNTLLATHKDHAILIDTKFASYGPALLQDARTLNNDSAHLTTINTHHHGDHTGGNAFLLPNAKHSYAQHNAVPRIQSQLDQAKSEAESGPEKFANAGASEELIAFAQQAAHSIDQITKQAVTPKHTFADSTEVEHPTTPVSLHHFGAGHTDNDLIVHFENNNIIHTGDLIFAGLHPFFFPAHGATALGWINSLQAVYKRTDKHTQIIPGHGQPGDRTLITNQISYLEQLVEQVQKQIDAGTPKEAIAEMHWDFMDGLGFEQIKSRAINAVYDELSQ